MPALDVGQQVDNGELARATAEINEQANRALRAKGSGPLSPEILVPRLGDKLIEQGMLRPSQLRYALQVQAERRRNGQDPLLGQLLVELGFVTREALDAAVTAQALKLHEALEDSNRELERRVQRRTVQLRNALVQLGELSQLKADFVANVSHELRTPLALVTGYGEMMATGALGALTQEQAQAMTVLVDASRQLGRMIEDLLNFSEATVSSIPLQLEAIGIRRPVLTAVDQSTTAARESKIELCSHVPEGLPRVQADRQKITWVISQFLDNAIKFTPPGGRVTVQAIPEDSMVTVAVADSGIGMDPDRIEEAFEAFHQLDGSMTRQYGGAGLGLALARRIVEAHGSSIDVYSRVGQGSRFAFSLPVAG